MTNKVRVRMEGYQAGAEAEPMVTITSGSCHYKNGSYFIRYEEKQVDCDNVTSNTIKISKSSVVLIKRGMQMSQMIFEKGIRTQTSYITPYGNLPLEIMTETLTVEDKPKDITVIMEYSLSSSGAHLSDNKLVIKIDAID